MPISDNIIRFIFATFSILKSHIYMVTILANLNTGYNNFDSNKPITIIEIIAISF